MSALHSTIAPLAAPLWRRLAAMLYDSFLIFAIWIIVGFIVMSAFGLEQARTLEGDMVVMDPMTKNTLFAAMMLTAFLFFGWFWRFSGQTLGMQAWRIKMVSDTAHRMSWMQVLIRFVTAPVSLALAGLGYWWVLFDPEKRSWPDIASHSKVIRTGA